MSANKAGFSGAAGDRPPTLSVPASAVHNHGIDPSCKETVIGGRRVGACIIQEEAELSGGMDLILEYRRAKGEIE